MKQSFCFFDIFSIYLQHICFPTHPSAPPPAAGELVVPDADSESKPTRTRVDEDRELQEAIMRPPEEGELAGSAAKQDVWLSKFCMNNDQSPWSVDLAGDKHILSGGHDQPLRSRHPFGPLLSTVYSVDTDR